MDLMWIIGVAVLGVIGAALSRVMADELKAWMPCTVSSIIDRAVRMLPTNKRKRFAEEWRSHVNEIPGDASKLFVALGFIFAASKMGRIHLIAQKRALDALIAAWAIFCLAPLLLLITLAIKLDSPGPALFMQTRRGFNGRKFQVFKFRTMTFDGATTKQAVGSDPRITRVGRSLRRANLDELPLLFNVLKGDMSIVGPRPHRPDHDNKYSRLMRRHAYRHRVKPGLCSWEQLAAPEGEEPTLEDMKEHAEQERWYVENWSLSLDISIIWRKFLDLLRGAKS
jgi:lipopolysaccharide/colanic/teichoic acid biosynthesis glycosyltransferase